MLLVKRLSVLVTLCVVGIGSVTALFVVSEDFMQTKNPFIRRLPPGIVGYSGEENLKFNTYYFAGHTKEKLYLGNYSAPLHVIELDLNSSANTTTYAIDVAGNYVKMKSPRLRVVDSLFFLYDGSTPTVLSGNKLDWRVTSIESEVPYFSFAEPINSSQFIFRANSIDSGQNIIGIFSLGSPESVEIFKELIKVPPGDSDPIFTTDGSLALSLSSSRISYVNRYHNEFMVATTDGHLQLRGRTIDTVSVPKVKIVEMAEDNQRMIGAPPLIVNRRATASENLLFVESALRGKYDDFGAWQRSSAIDVYSLADGRYYFSFYLNGYEKSKLRDFCVVGSKLVVLIEERLVIYNINQPLIDLL